MDAMEHRVNDCDIVMVFLDAIRMPLHYLDDSSEVPPM